jgi:flavin reductase (DIM6/NTAB) family NADH-FMN oxidoreductase RutF
LKINTSTFEEWDKSFRIQFVNSLTGYKGVHLIGTTNLKGQTNLGLFTNVFHISSSPALVGIAFRPTTVFRNTLENLKLTKDFTINLVDASFLDQAHYASANWEIEDSEFEKCHLTEEFKASLNAPFVKESKLKIGCQLVEETILNYYKTPIIIGKIVSVDIEDQCVRDSGQIDMEQLNAVAAVGLNQYYSAKKLKYMPYARVEEVPLFATKRRPDNIAFDDDKQKYNSHVLAYGSNVGAPAIRADHLSNWYNTSVSKFNHTFKNKYEKLEQDYLKLIEEFERNNLIYEAAMNFEPIVGETYYLYSDGSEKGNFLSLIPPSSWDKECLGGYVLNHDKTWMPINIGT